MASKACRMVHACLVRHGCLSAKWTAERTSCLTPFFQGALLKDLLSSCSIPLIAPFVITFQLRWYAGALKLNLYHSRNLTTVSHTSSSPPFSFFCIVESWYGSCFRGSRSCTTNLLFPLFSADLSCNYLASMLESFMLDVSSLSNSMMDHHIYVWAVQVQVSCQVTPAWAWQIQTV